MFSKKSRGSLKRAVDRAQDPEINALRVEIAYRKDTIAELELELSDTRNELARFEIEFETRVGHLQRRLEDTEDQLQDARRRLSRSAQWEDDSDADGIPDVMEQFKRTWTQHDTPPPPPPPKEEPNEVTKEELKALFRKLAKLYHPDLVTEIYEKKRRAGVMTKINQAYAAGDVATLQSFLEPSGTTEPPRRKSRMETIHELQEELQRLDQVVRNLQNELNRLINSDTVQLMLDVSIAQREGRDLLGEMAEQLTVKVERLEAEYRALL
jgi:chromosome segregation ATPase